MKDHTDKRRKYVCDYCSKAWDKPSDLPRIVQPKPEGLCEPVVERLVRLADVLGEDGDDGHLPHLLHHPGEPAPGPPHQLVHVVPHLGLVGASRGQTHQVALPKQGDQGFLAADLTLQMFQISIFFLLLLSNLNLESPHE